MGRHSSIPQVEDLGGFYWHITRVLDPDDEFAQKQVLSTDGWVDYVDDTTLDDYDLIWFEGRADASNALAAYILGFEDATSRASRAYLGS